jgi:hypothetical protein
MSRRLAGDYKKVFKAVLDLLGGSRGNVEEMMADFEQAVWKTIGELFPGVKMLGCGFHWTQALFRKIKQLGLIPEYRKDLSLRIHLKRFMSLHLIPHSSIPKVFKILKAKTASFPNVTPLLTKFVDYVERNWIASTKWPPASWSQFKQFLRTNNDVEGWHSRLNSRTGASAGMNFYTLIPLLYDEIALVPMQVAMLCQNQILRERRPQSKCVHNALMDAWKKYEDGELKSYALLKLCARINTELNALKYGKNKDDTRRDEPDTDAE